MKGNPGAGVFENPVVIKKKKKRVAAITHYNTVQTLQTSIDYRDIKGVELSLVQAFPKTGKWHQLRQHFAFNRTDIVITSYSIHYTKLYELFHWKQDV